MHFAKLITLAALFGELSAKQTNATKQGHRFRGGRRGSTTHKIRGIPQDRPKIDDGVRTHRPKVMTANYDKPECSMSLDRLKKGPANIPDVMQ